MNDELIGTLGDELHDALITRRPVAPLTSRYADIEVDDAYRIQRHMVGRRLAAGEKIVGKKVGLTSKAVQQMLGVMQPDFGQLLSGMIADEVGAVPFDSLIQPKAEGEIAFLLKRDLCGPHVTNAEVLAATEGVMACFEIVDSRIEDWRIRIEDTVADNASSGVFVLGSALVDPRKVDLTLCGMVLERNGERVATGAGAAALGSPVNAVTWLANALGRFEVPLRAGEVILSGSLAAMIPVKRGDRFRLRIGGIGDCSVAFA
ncbi:MAG: 2-oxopent-4-enoate hydratase [Gammaproteobacteria bacterium]